MAKNQKCIETIKTLYLREVKLRLDLGEQPSATLKIGEGSKGGTYVLIRHLGKVWQLKGDTTLGAVEEVFLQYEVNRDNIFHINSCQTRYALRTEQEIKRFHAYIPFSKSDRAF